ncbi:glycosyltransferase family 2 protein [Elioraea rosea]|uniref:glycosyltransferase family 2 protein n=1 Tax=Elioraea rosea TaxID=2492390 RepID=UPI00118233C4|nr:glycosyltransferase [Elioraea rosea]
MGAAEPAPAPASGPDVDADIVILSLDRIDDTLAAIESALGQSGITRHVWVADQGSRPENLARLEAFCAGREGLTLLAFPDNRGVAGGRNRVIAPGRGRVIIALDNDAEFGAPDTVAKAVAALDAEPSIAAIAFRILRYGDRQDDLSSWGYPSSLLPRAGETFEVCTFVGAGHAIRRAAFEAAGGYDDTLHFTWEEFDLSLRFIAAGMTVLYRGDLEILHKVSPERRFDWGGTRWFYHVRNRLYIEGKIGTSLPRRAVRWLAYLVKGTLNGAGMQTVRALPQSTAMLRRFRSDPASVARYRLGADGRAYLARNDAAHRGSALDRLGREVLSAMPGAKARRAAS